MSRPDLTSRPSLRGRIRSAPLDAPRRLALGVSVVLFVSLFFPWLSQTAVTHGLHGPLRLRQTMTGWQALSLSATVALLVCLAVPLVLLARRPGPGRERARRRLDGTIVAAGGIVCALALIWTLAAHEGSHAIAGGGRLHEGIGWGVALALGCAVALVALGGSILRSAARAPVLASARASSSPPRATRRTAHSPHR